MSDYRCPHCKSDRVIIYPGPNGALRRCMACGHKASPDVFRINAETTTAAE